MARSAETDPLLGGAEPVESRARGLPTGADAVSSEVAR